MNHDLLKGITIFTGISKNCKPLQCINSVTLTSSHTYICQILVILNKILLFLRAIRFSDFRVFGFQYFCRFSGFQVNLREEQTDIRFEDWNSVSTIIESENICKWVTLEGLPSS